MCAWKGRESVQTPAASGRFRLGSGHMWRCMEYTSYWITCMFYVSLIRAVVYMYIYLSIYLLKVGD